MLRTFITILLLSVCLNSHAQQTLQANNTEAILYLSKGEQQPLIVGLGGSEGGNAWASDHWKSQREKFIGKGCAFLALGYFGIKGTPPLLDKIAIEDVYRAIVEATKNPKIDKNKIAIIGGSRGADLALLLGSYYPTIRCIVAIVPSNAVFPGHTQELNSSCWTYQNKELPFIPVNEAAVTFLVERNLRAAFEAMLQDTAAEKKSLIRVEKIKGPILFLSATKDEICPSTPMSVKMMNRLTANQFAFHAEHIAIDGSHAEPLKHFDKVEKFIDAYFLEK